MPQLPRQANIRAEDSNENLPIEAGAPRGRKVTG